MKKIVLLVASILATLHSTASRSSNDYNNPLILSPSDGINSFVTSHSSHSSHYSMFFKMKADSIGEIPSKAIDFIKLSLSKEFRCDSSIIIVNRVYVSSKCEIGKRRKDEYVPLLNNSDYQCYLYFSYKKGLLSSDKGEYIIPLTEEPGALYYYIKAFPPKIEMGRFEYWMSQLVKILIYE